MSDAYDGLLFYDVHLPDYSAYELVASELLDKLIWINTWIDFLMISLFPSLLIYAAYKGIRYVRPYGGAVTFSGLTLLTVCALASSAYTLMFFNQRWWMLLLPLFFHPFE